jgi:hypothetical protein
MAAGAGLYALGNQVMGHHNIGIPGFGKKHKKHKKMKKHSRHSSSSSSSSSD